MTENAYYEEREHRCEYLIRIIQSREGTPSKENREEAFSELLEMFRPLIRRISLKVFHVYGPALRTDFDSFHHDTISTAVEMILADYVPKKYGGKAMFAPYLQTKLYYRTLWLAQKTMKYYEREYLSTMEIPDPDDAPGTNETTKKEKSSIIWDQVETAILSQVSGKEETAFDILEQKEIEHRVTMLKEIAEKKLTEQETLVWNGALFSGMKMIEIASALNKSLTEGENAWTKQRVYNFYHKIRIKVLSAYGEAALIGEV